MKKNSENLFNFMTPKTTDRNLFNPLSLMDDPFKQQQEKANDLLKNNPVTKAVTHAVADAVTDVVTDAVTDVVVNQSPFAMAQKSMSEVKHRPCPSNRCSAPLKFGETLSIFFKK